MDVSKLIEKAREATERRNYDYAIDLYLQALKLVPDDAVAATELRAVELRRAKEKPVSFFDKAKIATIQVQMQTLFSTKKYDSAIEKAEDILKIDPGNVGAAMILGRAAKLAGYRKRATVTFESIKQQNAGGAQKTLVEALRELGDLYEGDNKIKEAIDIWGLINRLVPGDRDAATKGRDLAAKSISSQIESAANSGQRGAAARSTQTDEQKKEAARRDIENVMDIKTAEDLQAAINYTKEDIAKRPDDPRISVTYAKLGDLYKMGSNYAESKKAYEAARDRDTNNPTYLFKLDDLEIWRMTTALKAMEPKAREDQAVRAQYLQGRDELWEFKKTSYLAREKAYSTDAKVKFELGMVFFDLATYRKDKGLFDEAITRFQATVKDPKYRTDAGMKLGLAFAAKGQYELALKRFDEAITAIPKEIKDDRWKNLTYAKADVLAKMKRSKEAKDLFTEIYEIDVKFRDISKRIDELGESEPQVSPA